jgi:hypothetical protein
MKFLYILLMMHQSQYGENGNWLNLIILLIVMSIAILLLYLYSTRKRKYLQYSNNNNMAQELDLKKVVTHKRKMNRSKKYPIFPEELQKAIHPNSFSRYILALIICIPILLIALYLTLNFYGLILIYFGIIYFSIWFTLSIIKAKLKANALQVNENNFPEILKLYREIQTQLNYHKEIPIYIYEEPSINAQLIKFFRMRIIILHSELVSGMLNEKSIIQLKWVIARFIGSLKVKQIRLNILQILIDTIEEIKIFNFFILPYERTTVYTGDNIGLLLCNNLNEVMIAFNKFVVGNKLASKVSFKGLINQNQEIDDHFFYLLARLGSPFPHMIDRYLNLIAFAKKHMPELYLKYINQFDANLSNKIDNRLPSKY